ncbi:MAG: hypothetical protein K6B41_02795 [Butyrivibrio sp.]|nr:hypothetical protein [Butyrivibrio sp.]
MDNRFEKAKDLLLSLLQWIVVSACGFVYWIVFLLVLSLILLNIWHVTFDWILHASIVLAIITSVIYGIIVIRRRLK